MDFRPFKEIPKSWLDGRSILFRYEYHNDFAKPFHEVAIFSTNMKQTISTPVKGDPKAPHILTEPEERVAGWHLEQRPYTPLFIPIPKAAIDLYCAEIMGPNFDPADDL